MLKSRITIDRTSTLHNLSQPGLAAYDNSLRDTSQLISTDVNYLPTTVHNTGI